MASTFSTPSQSARKIRYDVFFSFRATDIRKNFVDHFYKELLHKGIRTFKDDEGLKKGEPIEKLLQIIKESQFAIVVFSQAYASAKWCLEEIATIIECQQQYGEKILIPIFYDVEPSVVRNQTESFAESFKRHEEKENTEKLKRWKEALKKAGEISGYHLQNDFNGFEAMCVQRVTNAILTQLNQSIQASSTVLENNFVGLGSRLTDMKMKRKRKMVDQNIQKIDNVGYDAIAEDNNSAHGCFKRSIKYWQKGKVLGSGSFGKVYTGITDGGELFAVKQVSLIEDQKRIYHLQQEISLLSLLKHENIVRYLGTDKDDSNLYVFLELASKGSLASLYSTYQLDDTEVSTYTKQILSGLDYIHSLNVVHRDLKCANILIDDNGSVKLADFGLAKVIDLNDINSFKGTIFWMAPEVAKGRYGCSADIWSLGCTVLEMLTRKRPYHGFEFPAVMYQLFLMGKLPDIPEDLSEDAKDFIRKCLQLNPSDRPTAADLLQLHHPFLRTPSDVPSTSRL